MIALLKANNIRKIIASPGATNKRSSLRYSRDPYFEIYSSVDERSAAYMACGLAAESGEPVVLSCTGATASRNYLPGLTEAFLPESCPYWRSRRRSTKAGSGIIYLR